MRTLCESISETSVQEGRLCTQWRQWRNAWKNINFTFQLHYPHRLITLNETSLLAKLETLYHELEWIRLSIFVQIDHLHSPQQMTLMVLIYEWKKGWRNHAIQRARTDESNVLFSACEISVCRYKNISHAQQWQHWIKISIIILYITYKLHVTLSFIIFCGTILP